jgi:hypothetical protein
LKITSALGPDSFTADLEVAVAQVDDTLMALKGITLPKLGIVTATDTDPTKKKIIDCAYVTPGKSEVELAKVFVQKDGGIYGPYIALGVADDDAKYGAIDAWKDGKNLNSCAGGMSGLKEDYYRCDNSSNPTPKSKGDASCLRRVMCDAIKHLEGK